MYRSSVVIQRVVSSSNKSKQRFQNVQLNRSKVFQSSYPDMLIVCLYSQNLTYLFIFLR